MICVEFEVKKNLTFFGYNEFKLKKWNCYILFYLFNTNKSLFTYTGIFWKRPKFRKYLLFTW